MGLFGFGKKRTPAEILSEGRLQYVKGNLKKALSILRTLADEGDPQACCYVGRIYLELKDKSSAKPYLLTAAKGGIADAATLLAAEFGIRDYLPNEEEAVSKVVAPAAEKPAQEIAPENVKPDADEPVTQMASQLTALADKDENEIEAAKAALGDEEGKPDFSIKPQAAESEPVSEPIQGNISEPAPEPVSEIVLEPASEPVSEPASESIPEAEPIHEPASEAVPETKKEEPSSNPEPKISAAAEEAYRKGDDCMKELDWESGINYWTKAAKGGHPEALKKITAFYISCYKLGRAKYKPSREYIDYDKAIEWGNLAIKHGVDVAEDLMNAYVKKGQTAEAIKLGKKAAAKGMNAEWRLMQFYLNEDNYKEALLWGERYDEKNKSTKASQHIEELCTKVFDKGYAAYEKKDGKAAISYFEKSAELGSVNALFNIGYIYNSGLGIQEDKKKAFYWYIKAALKGHVNAQFNCGAMYDGGIGTKTDKVKALQWYEKAAEQGHIFAQYNCGNMYYYGSGAAKDLEKALYWYTKAAEQGDDKAQFKCGWMYENGEGVPEDKEKAIHWYVQAALKNHILAQFNLGVLYDNGNGIPQDKPKALYWYKSPQSRAM